MQIIAILANLILLIIVVTLIASNGLPNDGEGFRIIAAALAAPILSIVALMRRNGSISELISLEIQARKMTLRQRIADAEASVRAKAAGNDVVG